MGRVPCSTDPSNLGTTSVTGIFARSLEEIELKGSPHAHFTERQCQAQAPCHRERGYGKAEPTTTKLKARNPQALKAALPAPSYTPEEITGQTAGGRLQLSPSRTCLRPVLRPEASGNNVTATTITSVPAQRTWDSNLSSTMEANQSKQLLGETPARLAGCNLE